LDGAREGTGLEVFEEIKFNQETSKQTFFNMNTGRPFFFVTLFIILSCTDKPKTTSEEDIKVVISHHETNRNIIQKDSFSMSLSKLEWDSSKIEFSINSYFNCKDTIELSRGNSIIYRSLLKEGSYLAGVVERKSRFDFKIRVNKKEEVRFDVPLRTNFVRIEYGTFSGTGIHIRFCENPGCRGD
jgi:hypothetical protein